MALENAERLLEEIKKHPEAEEILKKYGRIETASAYADAVLAAAKQLGIETQTDAAALASCFETMEAARRASTSQAMEDLIEMEDSEMENVAGGDEETDELYEHAVEAAEKIKEIVTDPDFMSCAINDKCPLTWN